MKFVLKNKAKTLSVKDKILVNITFSLTNKDFFS